jgi:hypothetical protein
VDRVPELVQVVEVILPLLVQDVEHHERQQPIAVTLTPVVLDGVEAVELRLERLPCRFD